MTRKMLLEHEGHPTILEETPAPERELQEAVQRHPELLPIDDFGMAGPLLVIGTETPLPSGAVDLVGLSRGGDLLLVEFKIGPANSDFRRATSQLLDYGSDLWEQSVENFERTVALPYFQSPRCPEGSPGHGARSLDDAARRAWPDASDDDLAACRERLAGALHSGAFHYALVAQQFTESVLRTITYLDATSRASFYAVELVRFTGPVGTATEARTLYRPQARSAKTSQRIDEETFLDNIDDHAFRSSIEHVLDAARSLGYRVEWFLRGGVIKIPTDDHPAPLSVGWVFDDSRNNWGGLHNLTLGCLDSSLTLRPSAAEPVQRYMAALERIPGGKRVEATGDSPYGFEFDRTTLPPNETAVVSCLAQLAHDMQAAG